MPRQVASSAGRMILDEFTRGILQNTDSYRDSLIHEGVREILLYHKKLERQERDKKLQHSRDLRKTIRKKIKEDDEIIGSLRIKSRKDVQFDSENKEGASRAYLSSFRLSDSVLPDTVRHIRPIPRPEGINLGKLNQLLNDPFVKAIECGGPREKIYVSGVMGHKPTSIRLSNKEIDDVIMAFSQLGKIPVGPGAFNVFFGNLSISAMISEVVGSRFLIKKVPLSYSLANQKL